MKWSTTNTWSDPPWTREVIHHERVKWSTVAFYSKVTDVTTDNSFHGFFWVLFIFFLFSLFCRVVHSARMLCSEKCPVFWQLVVVHLCKTGQSENVSMLVHCEEGILATSRRNFSSGAGRLAAGESLPQAQREAQQHISALISLGGIILSCSVTTC